MQQSSLGLAGSLGYILQPFVCFLLSSEVKNLTAKYMNSTIAGG